jgi:hypothetical protein
MNEKKGYANKNRNKSNINDDDDDDDNKHKSYNVVHLWQLKFFVKYFFIIKFKVRQVHRASSVPPLPPPPLPSLVIYPCLPMIGDVNAHCAHICSGLVGVFFVRPTSILHTVNKMAVIMNESDDDTVLLD